jgi:ankyrin repeat protein
MAMANNPNIDIYLATKAGDFERVKYLVEVEDVNINRMDDHNSVPLFYACLCGHTGKFNVI